MIKITRGQEGISLLETLLAMTLTLVLVSSAWDFGSLCFQKYHRFEDRVEIQQQARIGLEMLLNEVRTAGLGLPRSNPAFLSVTPSSVVFRSNLEGIQTVLTLDAVVGTVTLSVKNGKDFTAGKSVLICRREYCDEGVLIKDGEATRLTLISPLEHSFPTDSVINPFNTVTYYLNKKNQLLRRIDAGGANEVASNLHELQFHFSDRYGLPTWEASAVRGLKATLVTRDGRGHERTFSSSVSVRNR